MDDRTQKEARAERREIDRALQELIFTMGKEDLEWPLNANGNVIIGEDACGRQEHSVLSLCIGHGFEHYDLLFPGLALQILRRQDLHVQDSDDNISTGNRSSTSGQKSTLVDLLTRTELHSEFFGTVNLLKACAALIGDSSDGSRRQNAYVKIFQDMMRVLEGYLETNYEITDDADDILGSEGSAAERMNQENASQRSGQRQETNVPLTQRILRILNDPELLLALCRVGGTSSSSAENNCLMFLDHKYLRKQAFGDEKNCKRRFHRGGSLLSAAGRNERILEKLFADSRLPPSAIDEALKAFHWGRGGYYSDTEKKLLEKLLSHPALSAEALNDPGLLRNIASAYMICVFLF